MDVDGEPEQAASLVRPASDPLLHQEVLHVSRIVADLFERELEQHAFTQAHADLRDLAGQISDRLNDFYQAVGSKDSD